MALGDIGSGKGSGRGGIEKLAKAAVECSPEAIIYGRCVLKHYKSISPQVCKDQFAAFKKCVQTKTGKKW